MAQNGSHGRGGVPHPASASGGDLVTLLARAAADDADAFMAFYDLTCAVAYRAARAICGDPECAEQMVCSWYARAWRNAAQYPGSGLSPTAWLLADILGAGRDTACAGVAAGGGTRGAA